MTKANAKYSVIISKLLDFMNKEGFRVQDTSVALCVLIQRITMQQMLDDREEEYTPMNAAVLANEISLKSRAFVDNINKDLDELSIEEKTCALCGALMSIFKSENIKNPIDSADVSVLKNAKIDNSLN